jgi:hypothetical protein
MEYTVKEYKGKGYTAIIRKPILTAEERRKREAEVRKALVEFGREMLRSGKNVM